MTMTKDHNTKAKQSQLENYRHDLRTLKTLFLILKLGYHAANTAADTLVASWLQAIGDNPIQVRYQRISALAKGL